VSSVRRDIASCGPPARALRSPIRVLAAPRRAARMTIRALSAGQRAAISVAGSVARTASLTACSGPLPDPTGAVSATYTGRSTAT